MLGKFIELLRSWGRKDNEKYESELPKHRPLPGSSGMFVNKGTRYDDDWVWEETVTQLHNYVVNVCKTGEDYVITIDTRVLPGSIDYMPNCDTREAELGAKYLGIYYSHYGNVTLPNGSMEKVCGVPSSFN